MLKFPLEGWEDDRATQTVEPAASIKGRPNVPNVVGVDVQVGADLRFVPQIPFKPEWSVNLNRRGVHKWRHAYF